MHPTKTCKQDLLVSTQRLHIVPEATLLQRIHDIDWRRGLKIEQLPVDGVPEAQTGGVQRLTTDAP